MQSVPCATQIGLCLHWLPNGAAHTRNNAVPPPPPPQSPERTARETASPQALPNATILKKHPVCAKKNVPCAQSTANVAAEQPRNNAGKQKGGANPRLQCMPCGFTSRCPRVPFSCRFSECPPNVPPRLIRVRRTWSDLRARNPCWRALCARWSPRLWSLC